MSGEVYCLRKYGNPVYSEFLGDQGSFSDLEIRVRSGGRDASDNDSESCCSTSWRSHKLVLASMSPKLKEMVPKRGNVLELEDVDGEAFKELVECFYKGELKLDNENVWRILRVSQAFGIDSATQLCEEYISEHCDHRNALAWYINARDTHLNQDITDQMLEKAQRSFNVLRKSQSFRDALGIELWEVLISDRLVVPSERVLLESILEWVSIDPEERLECFYKLLSTVRCQLMTSEDVKYFTKGRHPYTEFAEKVAEYVGTRARSSVENPRVPLFHRGVMKDVPLSMVYEVGWKLAYAAPYRDPTSVETLEALKGDCLLVAAARKGESKLAIAACGPRDAVLKRTENHDTHQVGDVFWYFNVNKAFGFSSLPRVALNLCDTCNVEAEDRMSWHVHEMEGAQSESGGFRAGAETHLTDSTSWVKLVFTLDEK
ncbi:hypothetical protein BSKO_10463 [Bryopsis sp. KO-2023]|nr:hypothetical protein BSKO_10463 [Bryopsis sp. KO-2023]